MKFSIAIPAYKSAYLSEAIESVLAQTFRDFELVVVDDASPEDLQSIVKRFDDSRIRYYRNKENYGAINVVDNWNRCLEYAHGDYIICMGDDDRLCSRCLEEYNELTTKYPNVTLFHGWTSIINEKSEITEITPPRPEYESVFSLIYNRLDSRNRQFIGDFLFKTDTLRKDGGFYKLPMAWGSDDISAVISASHGGVVNTQVTVFQYRVNSLTISSSGNVDLKISAIRSTCDWLKSFLQDERLKNLDEEASHFRLQSIEILPKYFKKQVIWKITSDIMSKGLFRGSFFWLLRGSRTNKISLSWIAFSILNAFVHKNSK